MTDEKNLDNAKKEVRNIGKNIPIELYSPMQIVVITYIATPMAGSILLAISFGRLGKTVSAKRALVLGGISTAFSLPFRKCFLEVQCQPPILS